MAYRPYRPIHMIIQTENVPSCVSRGHLKQAYVHTLQNVTFIILGIGGPDGRLQDTGQVMQEQSRSWLSKVFSETWNNVGWLVLFI